MSELEKQPFSNSQQKQFIQANGHLLDYFLESLHPSITITSNCGKSLSGSQ